MREDRPRLAITIGDPAGIGPEITIKALQVLELHESAELVVVGTGHVLRKTAELLGTCMQFVPYSSQATRSTPERTPYVEHGDLPDRGHAFGSVSAAAGAASVAYVEEAVRLAKAGQVDGIVTAPINKQAIKAAGIPYPGHTELLGALFGVPVETMFVVDRLRIFFLTRHMSLRQAIASISRGGLLTLLRHARGVLAEMGIPDPRIAVAGLNPHAGEDGLFGTEERDEIVPAVQEARKRGWNVTGPIGADSVFHHALEGRYDAVISLYHDQGHIAAKTYDFHRTVSVTTGLPTIRTSVDHGTAFDIAGQGKADARNMIEAIRVAADLVRRRKRATQSPGRDV